MGGSGPEENRIGREIAGHGPSRGDKLSFLGGGTLGVGGGYANLRCRVVLVLGGRVELWVVEVCDFCEIWREDRRLSSFYFVERGYFIRKEQF